MQKKLTNFRTSNFRSISEDSPVAVMSKRKHYFILATIVVLIAIRTYFMFNMDNGWYWLIPCFFGAMGWIFIYAASKSK